MHCIVLHYKKMHAMTFCSSMHAYVDIYECMPVGLICSCKLEKCFSHISVVKHRKIHNGEQRKHVFHCGKLSPNSVSKIPLSLPLP